MKLSEKHCPPILGGQFFKFVYYAISVSAPPRSSRAGKREPPPVLPSMGGVSYIAGDECVFILAMHYVCSDD
jgi:hypothetical protein